MMEYMSRLHCWIKITDGTSAPAPAAPIMRGPATAAERASIPIRWPFAGPKKPPLFAGLLATGWWHLDDDYNGELNGSVFEFHPIFGSRDKACQWLTTSEGKAWCQNASRMCLVDFSMVDFMSLLDPSPAAANAVSAQAVEACAFPDAAWANGYKDLAGQKTPLLPADWRARLKIDDPPAADVRAKECATLLEYKEKLRDADRQAEIVRQAQSEWSPILAVTAVAGAPSLQLPVARVRTVALMRAVLDNITPALFTLKTAWNRGRPAHCCAERLDPMFPSGPLYPGHPAYPSGHATFAHAAALVMSHLVPAKWPDFARAAERVSLNREIAGLHYPSDSTAGAALAKQLFTMLCENPVFSSPGAKTGLLELAETEWP